MRVASDRDPPPTLTLPGSPGRDGWGQEEEFFWYVTEALRRHRAHEVALADLNAETAQDVVGRIRVEIKIRHREVIEVGLGAEITGLAAGGDGDLLVLPPVELVGLQALQEIDC